MAINCAGSGGTSSAIGTGPLVISGGVIDNTTGLSLTLSTSNAVTWGGSFAFSTPSGGTANNLNLGTGPVTINNAANNNRTVIFNGTGTTLTLGGVLTNANSAAITVTVFGGGNTLTLGGLNLSNTTTAYTDVFNGTGNVNITGGVSGGSAATSGLTYSGNGTMTLGGTSTYTGATLVSSGLLKVSGSIASGSAVSVTGGAISGTGTIGGAVSVNGGGINLADGAVDSLAIVGNLSFPGGAATGNLTFDLGSNTTDKIIVTGSTAVTTAGGPVINFNQIGGVATPITPGTYTLIQGSGTMAAASQFALATTKAFGSVFGPLGLSGNNLQVAITGGTAGPAAAYWSGANSTTTWSTSGNWNTDATSNIPTGARPRLPDERDLCDDEPHSGAPDPHAGRGLRHQQPDFQHGGNVQLHDPRREHAHDRGRELQRQQRRKRHHRQHPQFGAPTQTIAAKVGLASSQTWTVASGGSLTVTGAISDFGDGFSLTKAGGGTLTLGGANTFLGGLFLNGGVTAISSNNQVGAIPYNGAASVTFNGGTLSVANGVGFLANQVLQVNAGGGTLLMNGAGMTLNGPITGTGLLTINGTGTLTYNEYTSTNTGGITVNGGVLSTADNGYYCAVSGGTIAYGPFGAGPLTFNNGSGITFAQSGQIMAANAFTFNGVFNFTSSWGNSGGLWMETADNNNNALTHAQRDHHRRGGATFNLRDNGTTTTALRFGQVVVGGPVTINSPAQDYHLPGPARQHLQRLDHQRRHGAHGRV